jgi:hypothetical protein
MIETQIAAAIPVNHSGKIPGQPENYPEFAHAAVRRKKSCQQAINVEPLLKVNQ